MSPFVHEGPTLAHLAMHMLWFVGREFDGRAEVTR